MGNKGGVVMKNVICLVSLMCCMLHNLCAQEIQVKRFSRAEEVNWIPTQRLDENSVPCALIRVAVPFDEHVLFRGNVIGSVKYEGNEYWVYLSEESHFLRVHYPGYETLLVNFETFGCDGVESKGIYELVLFLSGGQSSAMSEAEYRQLVATAQAEQEAGNFAEAIIGYEACIPVLQKNGASDYVRKIRWNVDYCKRRLALNRLKAEEWKPLTDGFCLFKANGKYGFVDSVGNVTVPPLYEGAWEFRDGIAWVMKDGLWGSINQAGEIVVPYQYKYIWNFRPEAYALNRCLGVTKDMKYRGVVDYKTGEEILPCKYHQPYTFEADEGEYFCYIDDKQHPIFINKKTGKEQFRLNDKLKFRYYLGYGYSEVYRGDSYREQRFGIVDKLGHEVFPCEFQQFELLEKAPWMVIVKPWGSEYWEQSERLYNLKQRVYVGGCYSRIIGGHSESLVVVCNEPNPDFSDERDREQWGVLNYFIGKEIIRPTDQIKGIELPVSDENPIVAKDCRTGRYLLYDSEGNRYEAAQSDEKPNYQCGYTRVWRKGKYGYANAKGELILECRYDAGNPFCRYGDIVATAVRIGEDVFFVTPAGERIEKGVILSIINSEEK